MISSGHMPAADTSTMMPRPGATLNTLLVSSFGFNCVYYASRVLKVDVSV